jgi:hypothetical protein
VVVLRWKDVDLTAGTTGVPWQITPLGWEPAQGRPATAPSRWTRPSSARAARAPQAQAAERLIAGEAWTDSGFVFTDEIGRPLHPQQVSDQFYLQAFSLDLLMPIPGGGSDGGRLNDLPRYTTRTQEQPVSNRP